VQVVAALLLGGIGLPIPEELALLSAGYFIARGVDARPMIAAALGAVLVGDVTMYLLGRGGAELGVARRLVGAARMARLQQAFARHGAKLLFAGRFAPGLRGALLVAAGAGRMPLWRLLLWDGGAALAGVAIWISLGGRLAAHLERVRAVVGAARGVVLVAVVVGAVTVVAWPRLRALVRGGNHRARV
jgi:membrane protein DedA with SNARE-associated domain